MVGRLDQVRSAIVRVPATRRFLAALVAAAIAGCDRPSVEADGRAAASPDPRNTPGYIVDSIHPPEEALRRFRGALQPVSTLDGPTSRDALVQRFIQAVEASDAVALRKLAVDRSEFAYLVYPESKLSKPPYRQPPDLAWRLLESGTASGINKLVGRGRALRLLGYRCPSDATREGALAITSGCVVRVRDANGSRDVRLFGRILERDGRYKFAGFASDL